MIFHSSILISIVYSSSSLYCVDSKSTYNSTFVDLTFKYRGIVNTKYPNITSLFEYNTIVIRTIYDCLPCMIRNDWFFLRYHDVLNELGQIHLYDMYSNPFYYYLLTDIIVPSKSIQKQIDSYSDLHFKNTNVIGLQLRTGVFLTLKERNAGFYHLNHSMIIQEAQRLYYNVVSLNYSSNMYTFSYTWYAIDF